MADADMIRAPVPRQPQFQTQQQPQFQTQQQPPPNQIRPNLNQSPQSAAIRPPPPPQSPGRIISGQPLRPQGPPPLRRIDSRGFIPPNQFPGNQQRPIGPSPNQPVRAPLVPQNQQQQNRPQGPNTWSGGVQQQNRPPFPTQQQQQNLQARPPIPRPPVPQPGTPNHIQFRPPFPQQQQQQQHTQQLQQQQQPQPQQTQQLRQGPAGNQQLKSAPIQNMSQSPKNIPDTPKMNFQNNSTLNNKDDDEDVIIGRATTPQKKPVDPMTQSQYGFLDNRSSNFQFENSGPKSIIQVDENVKRPSTNYTTFTENVQKAKTLQMQNSEDRQTMSNKDRSPVSSVDSTTPKSPLSPAAPIDNKGSENVPKPPSMDRPKLQRMASRGSMPINRKPPTERQDTIDNTSDNQPQVNKSRPSSPIMDKPRERPINTDPKSPIASVINTENIVRTPPAKQRTSTDLRAEAQQKVEANRNEQMRQDMKNKTPTSIKGDNDSGVDETTQGNERNGPGSPGSPLKSPTKISGASRPPSTTPSNKSNKSRSTSRSRILKTPEPEPVKKVPMNKIQVGHAPSPNLKAVRSKIGSLENASYKPGGGNVKIETKKIDIKATPRIEAKNDKYISKGGDKKIISTKLQWNAKSKIGSLENAHHKPGGGDKKIESLKSDFKDKAKPKVGSKDNVKHIPRGGDIKIQTHKIEIYAQSKIGSLDNVKHKPGGGDKRIYDDKEYLKNIEHPVAPSPPSQSPTPTAMMATSGADENLNQHQS